MNTVEKLQYNNVGMGQIVILDADDTARALLGSCVGLLLHCYVSKRSAFAHVVLAEDKVHDGPAGKYVNTAIPEMLKQLAQIGVSKKTLIGKVVGGASMFNPGGTMEIGKSNYDMVRKVLRENEIRLAAEDVGGSGGRKVTVDGRTGMIAVEKKSGRETLEI